MAVAMRRYFQSLKNQGSPVLAKSRNGLLTKYFRLLEEKPVATNLITSGLLGLTGDLICQFGIERKNWKQFDLRRAFAFTTFSAFYTGVISLRIFATYPKILPSFIMKRPLYEGLASSVLDCLVHSPLLYLPTFYVYTGAVSGLSIPESLQLYKSQFASMMTCLVAVWIPIQAINFSVVPRSSRVVFVCSANLVWNSIMDYIHFHEATA